MEGGKGRPLPLPQSLIVSTGFLPLPGRGWQGAGAGSLTGSPSPAGNRMPSMRVGDTTGNGHSTSLPHPPCLSLLLSFSTFPAYVPQSTSSPPKPTIQPLLLPVRAPWPTLSPLLPLARWLATITTFGAGFPFLAPFPPCNPHTGGWFHLLPAQFQSRHFLVGKPLNTFHSPPHLSSFLTDIHSCPPATHGSTRRKKKNSVGYTIYVRLLDLTCSVTVLFLRDLLPLKKKKSQFKLIMGRFFQECFLTIPV